jgi:bacterioferritin-associated ferredoxin
MVRISVILTLMIVCSCNLIREADIRAAAHRGHKDAESAYRSMGCEFECGGCANLADRIIEEALANPPAIDATAA